MLACVNDHLRKMFNANYSSSARELSTTVCLLVWSLSVCAMICVPRNMLQAEKLSCFYALMPRPAIRICRSKEVMLTKNHLQLLPGISDEVEGRRIGTFLKRKGGTSQQHHTLAFYTAFEKMWVKQGKARSKKRRGSGKHTEGNGRLPREGSHNQ